MTRLYVNLRCSRCGSVRGVATGDYFGSRIGDEDVYDGLCLSCKIKEHKTNKDTEIERLIDDFETKKEHAEQEGKTDVANTFQYALERLREVL